MTLVDSVPSIKTLLLSIKAIITFQEFGNLGEINSS